MTIVKEGVTFCDRQFDNISSTKDELIIIKGFNSSVFNECGNIFSKNNVNNSTINFNEKIKFEKSERNNSIIYNENNGINNIHNSNNDNILNKNNSFTPNFNNYNANSNTLNNNPQFNPLIKFNDPNFSFFKIIINNLKIVILKKFSVLIIGYFSLSSSTCFIKGYLLHIFVVYCNYLNDIFETAKSKVKEGILHNFKQMNLKDNSSYYSQIIDRKEFHSVSSNNLFSTNTFPNYFNNQSKKYFK